MLFIKMRSIPKDNRQMMILSTKTPSPDIDVLIDCLIPDVTKYDKAAQAQGFKYISKRLNLAFVFLYIVIIFQISMIKKPAKFETALPSIFISLTGIKIKLSATLTAAETTKGIIVCFAKPSACVQ